jgi:hypothetical protein
MQLQGHTQSKVSDEMLVRGNRADDLLAPPFPQPLLARLRQSRTSQSGYVHTSERKVAGPGFEPGTP